jgi:hypothetical protein
MNNLLKRILDDLDEISERHEEVFDTDVREQMYVAIRKGFIMPDAGYIVPATFGMFSTRGDCRVREAIVNFLADRVEGVPDATGTAGLVSRHRRALKHWQAP